VNSSPYKDAIGINLRSESGSPLTIEEMDNNFKITSLLPFFFSQFSRGFSSLSAYLDADKNQRTFNVSDLSIIPSTKLPTFGSFFVLDVLSFSPLNTFFDFDGICSLSFDALAYEVSYAKGIMNIDLSNICSIGDVVYIGFISKPIIVNT
jgi:hypothetical protein